ncbi:MAG: LamG domain-containing protein, partial [Pseudomonadales bacterium]
WVVPNNVSQEDARIITYSGSNVARNFALSQTLYNYEILHRSSTTDQTVAFSTADADERLQATLQHIVITFAPGQARQIYVNGQHTGDVDPDEAGLLNDWDNSFAFVLGNETDSNSLWQGTLRMVAIHNRALTQEQITQNYSVGVGEKFFLLFSVSHLIDVPEAFVVFEVSQFDSYSYLFSDPFFTSLDDDASFSGIPLEGIKLGLNGKEATVGQAYKNLRLTLDDSSYTEGRQVLSEAGTIIALEQGPDQDEFFLSFERIGTHENVVVEADPPAPSAPADLPVAADIGLKTFDEINATMAAVTGVSRTVTGVADTYQTIRQQLPSAENVEGFLSAHQMAVTQLAIQYCDALVENINLRASYFPGLDFGAAANEAFDTPAERDLMITPILNNMVGDNLGSQPANAGVETELNNLIDTLTACGAGCAADRTETVVKASCAAVLGSAVTLVQ